MNRIIENFERMLASGKDGALLRYGLGSEYLKAGEAARAIVHLEQAVALDPEHSASWKLLGKAREQAGDAAAALAAWQRGIAVAEARGDVQAAKEMAVFARRVERAAGGGAP